MKTNSRQRFTKGFTLIDTTLAVGLLSTMVLPILGLLAVGVKDAGEAQTRRTCESLRQELRLQLSNPEWPTRRSGSTATGEDEIQAKWEATQYFDRRGVLMDAAKKDSAWMEVRLEACESSAFLSENLEQVKAVFFQTRTGKKVDETVIQRMCVAGK
jgi:hypothetical protein